MSVTSLDVRTVTLVDHDLVDEPLLTLDALADAADRLPPSLVEHHLADIPRVLPGGETKVLDQTPGEIVRGVGSNGCWVMLTALARLPEYAPLLGRAAGRFELALRARGEKIVGHNLVAFIGAPGATVPVHFDRRHHLLLQVRGTKTVGTGRFTDAREQERQLERGMQFHRLNADRLPDAADERELRAGQALVIPAYTFHWVQGGDDVSIALTCTATTEATVRDAAVYRFNVKARRLHLPAVPPGRHDWLDRARQRVISRRDRRR
jgi:hypothetical protein